MLSLIGQSPSEGAKNTELDSTIEFVISSSVSNIEILDMPSSLAAFDNAGFEKCCNVFGVYVLALPSVPDSKLLHVANILAQYVDNDQDGNPDNEDLVDELIDKTSVLLMVRDSDEADSIEYEDWTDLGFTSFSVMYSDDISSSGDEFDLSLKYVIKFLFEEGYSSIYSDLESKRGSAIADYMDGARGGYYSEVPDSYPEESWFHYYDDDCDYECQISEYFYLLVSSLAEMHIDRCDDISGKWDLCTKDLVLEIDGDAASLVLSEKYNIPQEIPDGNYSPSAGKWIDISTLIVYISGKIAIKDGEFLEHADGPLSEITPEGDNIFVSIDLSDDFEQSQVVWVKMQVKDLDGKYLNRSYVFKTINKEPNLVKISPANKATMKSSQVIYLEFEDTIDYIDQGTIDVSLNGLKIVSSSEFQKGYGGDSSKVGIVDGYDDGSRVYIRIDPVEPLKNNDYILEYSVLDLNGNKLSGKISFIVNLNTAVLPAAFPQTEFIGFAQGVKKIYDIGVGDSLLIEWPKVGNRYYGSDAFILVYENEHRLDVFDSDPKYIAPSSSSEGIVSGLTTGVSLSYGVRALETYKDTLVLEGMDEAGEGLFRIPEPVELSDTVLADDSRISVSSVDGFPSSGILLVGGKEVVKYSSISESTNSFLLSSKSRGLSGTVADVHVSGDEVKLFLACQDSNTVIVTGTPTYHQDTQSDREINNEGLVVNNYSDNDRKFFQGFDFCGYHRPLPQQIFQGKNDCGSYLGGEFNGMRGMNLFDRMLNREEVLLDQTGEPVILLKRLWSGQTCSCLDSRRVHPKVRDCSSCYGSGYVGGFAQYENLRREDRMLMISYGDTQEDLSLEAHRSLQQEYEPSCWTLPIPAIRDRDLIVRFDFTGDIEYIYEVLHVTKEKLVYKHYSRQRLSLKRLDKTDVVYTFPFQIPEGG